MSRYRVDPEARSDLDAIYDYIARDNPRAAEALLDKIRTRFRLLAEQPSIGRTRPELAPRLRGLPVGNYLIFYRPTDDGVEIARVLHGSRDIDALF
jgi:toxin ParE1/3/4